MKIVIIIEELEKGYEESIIEDLVDDLQITMAKERELDHTVYGIKKFSIKAEYE